MTTSPAFDAQVGRVTSALSTLGGEVSALTSTVSSLQSTIDAGSTVDTGPAVDAEDTAELQSALDKAGIPPAVSSTSLAADINHPGSTNA